MAKIRALRNLYNDGLCFTEGKVYEVNKNIKNTARLMEVYITNDLGELHLIGSWWREFEIVEDDAVDEIEKEYVNTPLEDAAEAYGTVRNSQGDTIVDHPKINSFIDGAQWKDDQVRPVLQNILSWTECLLADVQRGNVYYADFQIDELKRDINTAKQLLNQ